MIKNKKKIMTITLICFFITNLSFVTYANDKIQKVTPLISVMYDDSDGLLQKDEELDLSFIYNKQPIYRTTTDLSFTFDNSKIEIVSEQTDSIISIFDETNEQHSMEIIDNGNGTSDYKVSLKRVRDFDFVSRYKALTLKIKAIQDVNIVDTIKENDFTYSLAPYYTNPKIEIVNYNLEKQNINNDIPRYITTNHSAGLHIEERTDYMETTNSDSFNYYFDLRNFEDVKPKYIKINFSYDSSLFNLNIGDNSGSPMAAKRWFLREMGDTTKSPNINTYTNENITTVSFEGEIEDAYLDYIKNIKVEGDWRTYRSRQPLFYLDFVGLDSYRTIGKQYKIEDVSDNLNFSLYDENWNEIEYNNTSGNYFPQILVSPSILEEEDSVNIKLHYNYNYAGQCSYTVFKFPAEDYDYEGVTTSENNEIYEVSITDENINGVNYKVVSTKISLWNRIEDDLITIKLRKKTDEKAFFETKNFDIRFFNDEETLEQYLKQYYGGFPTLRTLFSLEMEKEDLPSTDIDNNNNNENTDNLIDNNTNEVIDNSIDNVSEIKNENKMNEIPLTGDSINYSFLIIISICVLGLNTYIYHNLKNF